MNKRTSPPLPAPIFIGVILFGLAGMCCAEDFNYIADPPRVQVSADVVPNGLPYCRSSTLGSLICYSPSFVRRVCRAMPSRTAARA